MDGMEKEGIIISAKRIDAKIKVGKKLFDTKEEMFDYFIKLEKENEQLKKEVERFKKMKKNCLDVMRVQGSNLTDDYMAGMYNGMVVVYNSCFLKDDEIEKSYCSKNEYNKWELAE